MVMKNLDVKVKKGSITMPQLAKHLGVSVSTINYWLNVIEMDEVKKYRILLAIDEIKKGAKENVQ